MSNKGNILAIDDTPANLEIISKTLSDEGYKIATAIDGERAINRLKSYQPDLILLDIQMPGIDGFETCRQIKSNPETAKIPIIFITAFSDIESKIKGFSLGGVDYITKPFQVEEILVRVKLHLTLSQLQKQLQEKAEDRDRQLQEQNIILEGTLEQLEITTKKLAERNQKIENKNRELQKKVEQLQNLLQAFAFEERDCQVDFNIHDAMDSALLLLKHRLKEKGKHPAIAIVKEYGDLPNIVGSPMQLNQVFVTLLSHAIDRLDVGIRDKSNLESERNCPQVTIKTIFKEKKIVMTISNNHNPDIKEIPFGQGNLNQKREDVSLASAKQIIEEQYNGTISCRSERGQGTEFIISLY